VTRAVGEEVEAGAPRSKPRTEAARRICGPRERLLGEGAPSLRDDELVALLLRTGQASCDANALARLVLEHRGGLVGLMGAEVSELCSVPGLGIAKAASLLAAAELGRRISSTPLIRGDRIRGPHDVHRHFYQRVRSECREHFMVLLLDGRHRLMRESQVSQGTLTASLVHPREVFRPAVRAAAAAVILVHNHPSGDPSPSTEDLEVTERLAQAGKLLGIRVVDHVVVASEGFHSLRDHGQLDSA
jgi:DNA repair protein RadC